MKKISFLFVIFVSIISLLCGCQNTGSKKAVQRNTKGNSVNDILNGNNNSSTTSTPKKDNSSSSNASDEESSTSFKNGSIDVDLTLMNATMVFSQVYDMLSEPEKYKGQIVKINGAFNYFHDDTTNKDYYAIIIADATACCQQGMEFILPNAVYPDSYPQAGQNATVIGTFSTYHENDTDYVTLKDAIIEF